MKDLSNTDIKSSGDAETLQHSNTLSKGEHIDDYISPDGEKMSFFYFSNRDTPIWVQFKDRNTEKTSPLWIPKLNVNRNRDYSLLKIREYLADKNLRPEYSRLNKQVRFFSVHPKDKWWFLEDHCLSLPQNTVSIHQMNGCVSYVNNKNQVITWDWRDNRSHERSIPASLSTITITALAEQNDSLIVGYKDGQIFVSHLAEENASSIKERDNVQMFAPKSIWIWPIKSSADEIVAIGSSYFAVRYKVNDNLMLLIKSENGEVIRSLHQISGIWSVYDRFLVSLEKKKVLSFFDTEENEIIHKKDFSSELNRNNIAVLSDNIHVAMDEEISIWKISNSWITLKKSDFLRMWQWHDGVICIRNPSDYKWVSVNALENATMSWNELVSSIKKKNFIFLPSGTYVFPQCGSSNPCITYFPTFLNPQKCPKTLCVKRNRSITSMTLLSDGSIMYVTDHTRGSDIYVITIKGEHVFSCEEFTKSIIVEFKEMAGGSVVTRSYDYHSLSNVIKIITPRFVPSKNLIQVIELRSKLISDPNNLDIYTELAEKFLSHENCNVSDHHSAYHTYLDGLEAAVQVKNLYRARRFYEKVKNIFPNRDEPMRLFLSYLTQFPNSKMERNIHLDLLKVLENKNCKRRLFVGEGDFSFTEALVKKHIHGRKKLPLAIVATELTGNLVMMKEEVKQRINLLKELGVWIMFRVDAQKIHEKFKDERFERIHWNCPFGFNSSNREPFREVIPKFFGSCEKIQSIGDRIHVTLVQDRKGEGWHDYRQYENPIVEGSMKSEYRLVRKRYFGKQRYSGYQHKSTNGRDLCYDKLREFIFEKVSTSVFREEVTNEKIKNFKPMQNEHKQYYIKVNKKDDSSSEIKPGECYFECSTDDDSSDYYSD